MGVAALPSFMPCGADSEVYFAASALSESYSEKAFSNGAAIALRRSSARRWIKSSRASCSQ